MTPKPDLTSPVRNRYFYGKLLDSYHFELETDYHNLKRWTINRLVLGHGVVCGLDVHAGSLDNSIVISPGVAIDKWGREVVVPKQAGPYVIPDDVLQRARDLARSQGQAKAAAPAARGQAAAKGKPAAPAQLQVHIMLCYHECPADPVPVLTGECDTGPCAPGSIREQFRAEFREGFAPPFPAKCHLSDLLVGGSIDYPELTRRVSRHCQEVPRSSCVVLANVGVADGDPCPCKNEDIDITVRRIVYSNALLFDLLLGLAESAKEQDEDDSEN
jgi:hypothetical protein